MTTTYTPHEIRAAILRAADRVEREPKSYDFMRDRVPACGSPGCMLGWIGFELGMHGSFVSDVSCVLLNRADYCDKLFYSRVREAGGGQFTGTQALAAARSMRLYANAYFPATTTPMDPAYLAFRAGLGAITGVEVGS